ESDTHRFEVIDGKLIRTTLVDGEQAEVWPANMPHPVGSDAVRRTPADMSEDLLHHVRGDLTITVRDCVDCPENIYELPEPSDYLEWLESEHAPTDVLLSTDLACDGTCCSGPAPEARDADAWVANVCGTWLGDRVWLDRLELVKFEE